MTNTQHLCMSCMKEIGDVRQCPYCDFYVDSPQLMPYLPLRTKVSDRYLVGKLLDFNGDGATYMGWDIAQNTPIQMREFLPGAIINRDETTLKVVSMAGSEGVFKDSFDAFLELWRKLVRMRGLKALVSTYDIVEDYNTVYAITEHTNGQTLRDYLLESATGYMSWEQARTLFMPALSTLGTLHSSGIVHRGISPHTLLVSADNKLKITGFSIAGVRTARGDLTAELFPGYAAIEQYGFEGQQGSWTDIYAFAAVLYRLLIGSAPIEATSRVTNDKMMIPGKFVEEIPAYVINALINGLQILPEDRTRSVEEFRAELSATPSLANSYTNSIELQKAVAEQSEQTKKKDSSENKKTAAKAGVISLVVCLIIITILAFTVFRDKLPWLNAQEETTTEITTLAPTEITVAMFEGRSSSELQTSPAFLKNYAFTVEEVYSDTIASGLVVQQIPTAHSMGRKGADGKVAVTLKVSKGIEKKQIPNVVGKTYEEAVKILNAAGFKKIERINKANESGQVGDTVFSVTPTPGGEQYELKETIFLQVWDKVAETEQPTEQPPETTTDIFARFR